MAARPKAGRETRVCVAQIGAAHGLKGEVRLRSFTQDPLAIESYGALESADGKRTFTLTSLRAAKDHFVAKLSGVDDRNTAEALNNVELYIPRERLPDAEPDEFYHADLIGLTAVANDGATLGEITAILNFGAGDILEIKLAANGETVLLPFTERIVPEIDLAARRIVIDPPEGALDQPSSSRTNAALQDELPPPLRGRSAPKTPGGG